jgi:cytoskeleton protein RodZ
MISVGDTLKRERLKKNLGLEQVSRETKINEKLLEFIESERFDKLPGGVFTRSFVRQYARFLGLDDEELVGELNRNLQPAAPDLPFQATHRVVDVPRVSHWDGLSDRLRPRNSSLPAFIMVLIVMMACAGAYTLWQRARRAEPSEAGQESRAATTARSSESPAPAQTPEASAPETSAREQSASVPRAQPEASAQPGPASAASQPPSISEARAGALHVVIAASEPTWLSIHADEKYIYSGTLATKEIKTVDASGSIKIHTGNAGGVEVTLNGKSLGPLGPRGQIRAVEITSAGVQTVPRKPVISSDSL